MRSAMVGAVACLLLAGCVPDAGEAPRTVPSLVPASPRVTISHGADDAPAFRPSAFILRYGHSQLELLPYTYCYSEGSSGGCADGFDADPPSIGSPKEVFVFVPVGQFDQLVVNQQVGDDLSSPTVEADTQLLGNGWWRVRPRGPAGDYRVSIFASDTDSGIGDMVADIRWRTSTQ